MLIRLYGMYMYIHVCIFSAEAIAKYGEDNIKIYKSEFVPMYYAVVSTKHKCHMKLICAGKDEKVCKIYFDLSYLVMGEKILKSLQLIE